MHVGSSSHHAVSIVACTDLVVVCRLSSCGTWAWLFHGVWDLSFPTRDEPMSPALQGGFLTTGPPGESL